ncbi:insulinase family protein [Sphingomicrobium sp. XHP0235]|uniref:M16 family metallopeptidase n=1 Tax=Sphingomicrobium aquimarinum TaxID=3133971 RepID=UPI0031FEF4E9
MRMIATLMLASSALALTATPAAAQEAWGTPVVDVQPDEAIRYGVLDNGMRYAIMKNGYRPGQAAVRLSFGFGALNESDEERGLAHFIEHMAFNGTTNVGEDEMVSMLERQGLAFGADTNAETGFDRTTYKLDLPQVDEERLDTAFFLMREVASEILFDQGAIDRERGVLLGEKRVRNTWQEQNFYDGLAFFMPEARFRERQVIGTEESLKTVQAPTIRSLYQRYYRPENATFVFVGDVDPAQVEARIRETFADWKGVGEMGAAIERGRIDLARPAAVDVFTDPAIPESVTLRIFREHEDPADVAATRRQNMVEGLATGMFNTRLQRISTRPDSVILGAGMGEGREEDLAMTTSISATVRDGEWATGLATIEQEARRAIEFGFSERELERVKAEQLQRTRTYVQNSANRSHAALASQIVGIIDQNDIIAAPQTLLALTERFFPEITLEEVNAAFVELLDGSAPLVRIASKTPVADEAVVAALDTSRAVAVAAEEESEAVEFAYADWGAPGTVVTDTMIEDLGIRTLTFDNGVKLNLKTTDFQDDKVSWNVSVDGGTLPLGADGILANLYSQFAIAPGGTAKHSFEEIDEYIAGRPLSTGFGIGDTAIAASGTLQPEFLEDQLEITAAYLTDYGYRAEADARWANIVPLILPQLSASPGSVWSTQAQGVLANGDPRFTLPDQEAFAAYGGDALRNSLGAQLANGAITVSVVGDMDADAVIAAVASTFGTLAPRAQSITSYDPAPVSFIAPGSEIALAHSGEADQALAAAYWLTDDDANFEDVVGLSLLRSIMDLELTDRIREEMGASYGVDVISSQDRWNDGVGSFSALSIVDPAAVDDTLAAFRASAADLAAGKIDADLMQRARAPMLEEYANQQRSNSYWLGYAGLAQRWPERLERARNYRSVLESLTAADMQSLAARYLTDDRLRVVRILSDKAPAQ